MMILVPGSSWTFAHGLSFGHVHDRLVIAVDHTTTTAEGGTGGMGSGFWGCFSGDAHYVGTARQPKRFRKVEDLVPSGNLT